MVTHVNVVAPRDKPTKNHHPTPQLPSLKWTSLQLRVFIWDFIISMSMALELPYVCTCSHCLLEIWFTKILQNNIKKNFTLQSFNFKLKISTQNDQFKKNFVYTLV